MCRGAPAAAAFLLGLSPMVTYSRLPSQVLPAFPSVGVFEEALRRCLHGTKGRKVGVTKLPSRFENGSLCSIFLLHTCSIMLLHKLDE